MSQYVALLASFGIPLFIVIVIGVIILAVKESRRRFYQLLKMKVLVVNLPQNLDKKGNKEELAEINSSAQLLSLLANQKIPFALEVSVHNVGEDIHFYISVPEKHLNFAARQIQAIWPDAQINKASDYTIFNSQGAVKAAHLGLKKHYALPIRTYDEATIDTFLPILNNFSKLEVAGEGISFQIMAKPAEASISKTIGKFIQELKRGASIEAAIAGHPYKPAEGVAPVVDDQSVQLLTQKNAKPIFKVNVRLITSAISPYRAEELFNDVTGSLNQFTAPGHNEFKVLEQRNYQKLVYQYVFREFDDSQAMYLGTDELVSIWHLPTSGTEVPKIKWIRAKEAAPPTVLSESGVLIGESFFRGEVKKIYISDEDRRRHVYTIGQTGTGKSTLLINMAAADMANGKGIAVIDPHGELIDAILKMVPQERAKDVIIFNPGDLDRPVGLNMLDYDRGRPEEKTFIVNEVQGIFNKLFTAETMGPMFEQYMKNALLLLMDDPNNQATLMEVPRVFTDKEFRAKLLEKATNPTVVDFWTKEATKAGGEASLANITPYITSKFNNFISNDYVRPIIGQHFSALKFRNIMDEGKILLVNLSKGRIGDINAGLLGMVVVGKILISALSRVDLPENQRRDFSLYIDEFQNFTTDSISTILSEARKYRLNLVVAHQFIAQLNEKIRDAVFGNVGSQIVFRVGADDAKFLVKQFEPVFSEGDLMNIDNFNAFAKLLINGQTSKPFNVKTIPPGDGNPELGATIRESSRQSYGKDRQSVEADIVSRLRS